MGYLLVTGKGSFLVLFSVAGEFAELIVSREADELAALGVVGISKVVQGTGDGGLR